jgi:FkbM family methyltransferase
MDFSRYLGGAMAEMAAIRAEIASLRARQVLYAAAGIDAIVSRDGFDFVVPTKEEGLLAYLVQHGVSAIEPAVRAAIRRNVKAGDRVIDAGANIGLHSVVLAQQVGPSGQLLCFEPIPHLAAVLTRTLRLNGYGDRSQVIESALAETVGEVTLHVADHSPESSFYKPDGVGSSNVVVKKTTVDDIVGPGGRLDFLKMDVEGAEPLVWQGMQRTIRENASLTIVLEWSASHFARSGFSASDFLRQITEAGFHTFLLRDDQPDVPGEVAGDAAAVIEAGNLLLTTRAAP